MDGAVSISMRRNANDETKVAGARAVAQDCAEVTEADRYAIFK